MSIRILVIALVLAIVGCNTTEPPPPPPPPPPEPNPTITLEAVDAGVTEAWLRLSIPDTVLERSFTLTRDSQLIFTTSLVASDTVLLDESLLANHTYLYRAYRLEDTTVVDTSESVSLTTLDTTSHDFTFDIDTLGGASSSVLLDVAIIDENNIWAVGEVYVFDSTGQIDPKAYGAAVWDGNEWNLKRYFYDQNGTDLLIAPIRGILAFSSNDVWFAAGSVFHWNGLVITPYLLRGSILFGGETVEKLWGTSSTDVYGVGNEGTIVHYNGTTWQKLESGTELPINDLWGALDGSSGEYKVLAVASNQFMNEGSDLLQISSSGVGMLPDSGLSWALNSVWFIPDRVYYIAGDGLYVSQTPGPVWMRDMSLPPYYKTSVRGTALNNVVVVGAFGLVLHYNGSTWRNYQDVTYIPNGSFGRVAVKENLLVAVGGNASEALVLRGTRQ